MSLAKVKSAMKKQNNWLTRLLYQSIKSIRHLTLPAPAMIFKPLLWLHLLLRNFLKRTLVFIYWQPLFFQYLANKPKRLRLENTMPFILANPKITLGDDCRLNGDIVISGKMTAAYVPELIIGHRVGIQYQSQIYIGTKVIIGNDCRIAEGCILRGYAGHPLNADDRRKGYAETSAGRGDIILESNVWLGQGVRVNPNVRIGKNSVIATGSIVTQDIPANVIAAGIPAKVIRKL